MKLTILCLNLIAILLMSTVSLGFSQNSEMSTKLNISDWEQINIDGFGSRYARGPRGIEIFNDTLVIGTANFNSDTIFEKGKSWKIMELRQFYFSCLSLKNIPSDGCEIWGYKDGNWSQLVGKNGTMPSGFGDLNNSEIGFLIKFKNYLYAGLRNALDGGQIWRTNDLINWEMVADKGLGNIHDTWFMEAAVFNNELYVGTYNYVDGCEIFRTDDGVNWTESVGNNSKIKSGFGFRTNVYAWSSAVYDGHLYIGTNNLEGGCELWKTKDGVNWKPVIAYRTWIEAFLHGADFPRGFSRKTILDSSLFMAVKTNFRGGIRSMVVYKDELYLGIAAEDLSGYLEIQGLGKILTIQQGFPRILYPIRRMLSMGCEIWKYNATSDKWAQVVGGINKGNFSGGFGDITNEYPWSMIVHDDYMYVGTMNGDPMRFTLIRMGLLRWNITWNMPTGNAQLWRYDGKKLEKINENAYGDNYNVGIREMMMYHNSLFASTMNLKTGCKVWKCDI